MTAAATTGPASGPRPASSTPAIKPGTSHANAVWTTTNDLALKDSLDGIGGESGGIALQVMV